MWLDRQQKNLYLEQFTKTDKELIKPDRRMKYRETPEDNFTLAIPGRKLSLLGATKTKKKQTQEQMPRRGTFTDCSQENTTEKSQLIATTEPKMMRPKMLPVTGEKHLRFIF